MQYILGILVLLAVFSYVMRKLFNRSEHKRFIDNAERFAEENQYTKEEHDFFKGEMDYKGKRLKSEMDNEYMGWFSEDETRKN